MKSKMAGFWAILIVVVLSAQVFGCGSDPGENATTNTGSAAVEGPREYRRGLELVRLGNLRGAILQFRSCKRKFPDFLDGYYGLAQAYVELGPAYVDYFDSAQAVYGEIQERVGEDDLRLQKGIAVLKMISWQVDDALILCEELLANSPEDCELWVLLGDAERRKGMALRETQGYAEEAEQMKIAEQTYRKALELCPDDFSAYRAIALIMNQRKQYTEVAKMYDELMERHPKSAHVIRQSTYAHFKSRHWKVAARQFGWLMEIDPVPEDRLMYISALRNSDQFELAAEQVRIYKETAPKLEGPKELTKESVLREELGIPEAAERATALMEQKEYDQALVIWRDARSRVVKKLDDDEFSDAAERVTIWLDRRIQYTEGLKKGN